MRITSKYHQYDFYAFCRVLEPRRELERTRAEILMLRSENSLGLFKQAISYRAIGYIYSQTFIYDWTSYLKIDCGLLSKSQKSLSVPRSHYPVP